MGTKRPQAGRCSPQGRRAQRVDRDKERVPKRALKVELELSVLNVLNAYAREKGMTKSEMVNAMVKKALQERSVLFGGIHESEQKF